MNRKKSLIIKLVILLSLLTFNVVAATPGSNCLIRAKVLGITVNVNGRVTASGNRCVPLGLLPTLLIPLSVGVDCGAVDYVLGIIKATVTCPN
jgi:hypothetical protein